MRYMIHFITDSCDEFRPFTFVIAGEECGIAAPAVPVPTAGAKGSIRRDVSFPRNAKALAPFVGPFLLGSADGHIRFPYD